MANEFFIPNGRGSLNPFEAFTAGRNIVQQGKATEKAELKERQQALFTDAKEVKTRLERGDEKGARKLLQQRLELVNQLGGDPSDTFEILKLVNTGGTPEALDLLSITEQVGIDQGFLKDPEATRRKGRTAKQREFASFIEIVKKDPEGKTVEGQAALISLGLASRSSKTAKERIAQDPVLTEAVALSESKIKGDVAFARETSKLTAKLKLEPQVKANVAIALSDVKVLVEQSLKTKSNADVFNIYEIGISNVATALGDTTTGPVFGRIPAISANAQIADGTVAALAPILKQLFRGAGEGTFTDKDQELLLAMIPTRATDEDAIPTILANIDAIIRAKLGQPAPTKEPVQNDLTPAPVVDNGLTPAELAELEEFRRQARGQ